MTTAPAPGGAAALVVPVDELTAAAVEGTPAAAAQHRRPWRTLAGWLLLAAAAILLWPASLGGLTGLTVVSGQSMEPTYVTGDLVVTWRSAGYEIGDIVSYTVPAGQPGEGGHVIHRVSDVTMIDGEPVYTTLGDNNPAADQWQLTTGDITGAAVIHVPGAGALLGPALLPYLAAAAIGAIVTVLLWRGATDDDDTDAQTDTDTDTAGVTA